MTLFIKCHILLKRVHQFEATFHLAYLFQVFEAYIDEENDAEGPDYSWDEYLSPEEKVSPPRFGVTSLHVTGHQDQETILDLSQDLFIG